MKISETNEPMMIVIKEVVFPVLAALVLSLIVVGSALMYYG